MTYIGRRRTRS